MVTCAAGFYEPVELTKLHMISLEDKYLDVVFVHWPCVVSAAVKGITNVSFGDKVVFRDVAMFERSRIKIGNVNFDRFVDLIFVIFLLIFFILDGSYKPTDDSPTTMIVDIGEKFLPTLYDTHGYLIIVKGLYVKGNYFVFK